MKKDSKIFWKFIPSKTKTKENIPCIIDEKGEINTSGEAKSLNRHFLISAVLLSSFILGVSYFLDIDLLSGMFSS
jgi:hypothetical protein